jgi:hypothetical protein
MDRIIGPQVANLPHNQMTRALWLGVVFIVVVLTQATYTADVISELTETIR